MNASAAPHKNRLKSLIGWSVFYLLLFSGFLWFVYNQSAKINTLELPQGQIQLTTSRVKYTVGDPISYTITNGLPGAISLVNNCPRQPLHVYRWDDTAKVWTRLQATAATPTSCSAQPPRTAIAPGKSITANYNAWPKLFSQPGIYRLVALADNYNGLAYADFEVVAPPPKPLPAPVPIIIYKPVPVPVYTPIYVPAPRDGGGGGGGDN